MNNPTLALGACAAALGLAAAGVNNGIATLALRGAYTQRHVVLVNETPGFRVDAELQAGVYCANGGGSLPSIPAVILTL
jgi:hypothetical protein